MSQAVCLSCGEILVSRHVHDCVFCKCDNHSMLDGGNDYHRIGGKLLSQVHVCKTMAEANRLAAAVCEKLGKPTKPTVETLCEFLNRLLDSYENSPTNAIADPYISDEHKAEAQRLLRWWRAKMQKNGGGS